MTQPTAAEQDILREMTVRLIRAEERTRFDDVLEREHYLHSAELVGEQLRYVAEHQGRWLALLSWSAAAYHLKDREVWLGWTPAQRARRLPPFLSSRRPHGSAGSSNAKTR